MDTKADIFEQWAEENGARCEVTQENDGSGYTVFDLAIANCPLISVTVNE